MEVIRDAVMEFQLVAWEQQEQLYDRLLHDLASKRLPERRVRSNPRVVKRKMSNFKLKRAQHYRLPKPEGSFHDAVVVQPPLVLEVSLKPSVQPGAAILELGHRETCVI